VAVLIIIIINYDNNGNFFVCFASNVHASMMLNKRKKEKGEKKCGIKISFDLFFSNKGHRKEEGLFTFLSSDFFFRIYFHLVCFFFAKVCGF